MVMHYYPCPVSCNGCDVKKSYPKRILEALESKTQRITVRGFENNYALYLDDLDAVVLAFDGKTMAHGSPESLREIGDLVQKHCTLNGYKTQERPPLKIVGKVIVVPSGD